MWLLSFSPRNVKKTSYSGLTLFMLRRSFIFPKVTRVWTKESISVASTHFPEGIRAKPCVVDPAQERDSNTSAKQQRIWTLTEGAHRNRYSPSSGKGAASKYIDRIVERVKAYGDLVRFTRPAGWQLLLLPCYWGTSLAVTQAMVWEGADPLVLFAPFIPLHLAIFLLTGAYLMRCAGCIVNDMCDRKFDAMVARTANRPLVGGRVSMREASYLLVLHLLMAGAIVVNLSPSALVAALAITPIWVIYPLMKRITYVPQLILGLCFNWGIFVGYAAVLGRVDVAVCLPAYIAAVCWTVLYDTIYAYQDRDDDLKCGVKSLALWIGDRKYILHAMLVPIAAGLLLSGFMVSQSLPYYVGVMICMYYLHGMLDDVNIYDKWSCAQFFKRNVRFGVYVFLAMCLGNLLWAYASEHEEDKDGISNSLAVSSPLSRFLFLDQKPRPRLYNAESFNWFDRLVHPAFVQTEIAKASGASDPPPIPSWMRREYIGDNITVFMRFCGVPEEKIAQWARLWYATMDHYNVFPKLVI